MAEDLKDAIKDNASGPKRASGDAGSVEDIQHPYVGEAAGGTAAQRIGNHGAPPGIGQFDRPGFRLMHHGCRPRRAGAGNQHQRQQCGGGGFDRAVEHGEEKLRSRRRINAKIRG